MLIKGNCSKCKREIGVIQYTDHFFCKKDWGEYVCMDCYEKGQRTCIKCNSELHFHSAQDTIQLQDETNMMI